VIDLGMGNRRRVWSSYGGAWHQVRIRYPSFWPRYGRTAARLFVRGALGAALGGLVLYYWARSVAAAVAEPAIGQSPVARFAGTVTDAGLLVAALALGYGLYLLVRTAVDLATPATITGQVLWRQVWRQTQGSNNHPPRPWLHYLAIDDGTADQTTAWGLPSEHAGRCHDGDTVTITVRRWSRRILTLTVIEHGGAGRGIECTDPARR
jgi:hypothetical protein